MKWLNKLNYKYGRYSISNLMMYITGGMLLVFLLDLVFPALNLWGLLYLNINLVAQGQVWRLVTFIFLPPDSSILFIVFSLYFYWMIGQSLEQQWGSFRFNVFYLVGIIGTIIGALFTGYAVNNYLNLSLFFAFALLYPDVQVRLFFLIPIKVKWLALANLVLFVYSFIVNPWPIRISILISLLNVLLFFGPDWFRRIRSKMQYQKTRRNFKRNYKNNNR